MDTLSRSYIDKIQELTSNALPEEVLQFTVTESENEYSYTYKDKDGLTHIIITDEDYYDKDKLLYMLGFVVYKNLVVLKPELTRKWLNRSLEGISCGVSYTESKAFSLLQTTERYKAYTHVTCFAYLFVLLADKTITEEEYKEILVDGFRFLR